MTTKFRVNNKICLLKKKYFGKVLIAFTIFTTFIFVYFTQIFTKDSNYVKEENTWTFHKNQQYKYLINTSKCKIPDADPFNKDVVAFVRKERYFECTNLQLLTYIEKTTNSVTLHVNDSLIPYYSSFRINCCYAYIFRNEKDKGVTYSSCVPFSTHANISHPFIQVRCSNIYGLVYINVHATTVPTEGQTAAPKSSPKTKFSVLLVGIDSISKLNLVRTMPKTHRHLEANFLNLKGYNKIGDNTFPNLMAILSGQNNTSLGKSCSSKKIADDCDILWKEFKSSGYVTAYAEDEVKISTFNFERPGFLKPPTDYYYRPYFIAALDLPIHKFYGMTFCTGPETSGERLFNIAKDFSISLKVPKFGLFWTNSFSHDNINFPSSMDDKVLSFLNDTQFKSSLGTTILVFFSDHGFRFGDIRYTHTGWLEERLPFIYVYIPDSFKREHPDMYGNLLTNSQNRLTTPYDIYMTLQEVLKLSNESFNVKRSTGCPKCQSLFEEVKDTRTCSDASIEQHWCTCSGHTYINPGDKFVVKAAEFVVREINAIVKEFEEGSNCQTYHLRKVMSAGVSENYLNGRNESVNFVLVVLETKPRAIFEATVEASMVYQTSFRLLGDISRINIYGSTSGCVEDATLRKYCYCDNLLTKFKSAVCYIFSC